MLLTERIYTTSVERYACGAEWEGGETTNSKIPSIFDHVVHSSSIIESYYHHRYEGMVDKFIGDAVFALWGVTPGTADPIQQAFQCAQGLLEVCARLSFGGVPLQLGIGLNAGRVFSGNVGSEGKRQFTVLGHPVNLAARCEQATKELHAPMVMSEDFARRLPPALFALLHKHDQVALKGAGCQTLYTYAPVTT